jgi:uncharacterized protein (TIGR02246 family)
MVRIAASLIVPLLLAGSAPSGADGRAPLREDDFKALMTQVADGWNEGNAAKAAESFAEDAVYIEPPNHQVYLGKKALYKFFEGPAKPPLVMHMAWHHLAFDEKRQVGFGEYTFEMNHRYHGVVVVLIREGKIARWREYQYKSDLAFETFAGLSGF